MHRPQGGIAGAAVLLTVLAAVSAVLGLARDVVIAAVFGAGGDVDAYLVAQGLMNLVLALAAGAVAKATVPVVARQVFDGGAPAAHRSALIALSMTTLVLAIGSIVMWLAAGTVIEALAPGFDAEQAALARSLTRIVLVATVLIAGTNLLAAVAQAHGRYFWSGVQGIPFNVVMIVAASVFGPRYGVRALAVGFVVGSGVRLVAQFVPLRALGVRLAPSFAVRDRGFHEIVRLVPFLLVGSAIGNVNTLVDRAVGSGADEGTIAALNYGWRVAAMAEMLLIAPLVTALYPSLGAARASVDFAHLVQRGAATLVTVLAPLVALLIVARQPIVALIFGRGDFDAEAIGETAQALAWYAPAVIALGWREVVSRASYAVGDTRSPVLVALGAMLINVVGDVTVGVRLGLPGLAASTTLSLVFAAVMTSVLLARRADGASVRPAVTTLVRTGSAAAAAALVALVALGITGLDGAVDGAGGRALAQSAVAAASVAVVYVAALAAVRAPELTTISRVIGGWRRGPNRR